MAEESDRLYVLADDNTCLPLHTEHTQDSNYYNTLAVPDMSMIMSTVSVRTVCAGEAYYLEKSLSIRRLKNTRAFLKNRL